MPKLSDHTKQYDLPVNYYSIHHSKRRKVREQYIREQDGKCFFCGNPLDEPPTAEVAAKPVDLSLFPPGFMNSPVHLQHDHDTGMTEGAVHAKCNAVMWQYHGR